MEPGNRQDEKRGELAEMRDLLREFVRERDWSRFHSPKNLAAALSVEASELLEPFTWLASGDRSELDEAKLRAIRHEMADVLAYLVMLADALDVDLYRALVEKMALNREKYPAERVKGDARKYTDYSDQED
ncbi:MULTISPECIES: nucleotide pyrophosphohydrolase [unclassified Caballeronia]|uniref:nucleotide pyrophosphohydrolase n=1 Tax=unclassified Caballeronia TaxID=2646786 RepID=UPI002857343F|nr:MULTISPECIES: nucleotide pyrophosphohydrolase [unclassified Caballeronia]MDR5817685.1 nucleotide pyrophosphohydrolase [Caballeronia sp. LZ033]MDR5824627.1 nucleotide pyrophosphohydrolase [Caballeronia sp. LZ043]